jgi:hypothetical protein
MGAYGSSSTLTISSPTMTRERAAGPAHPGVSWNLAARWLGRKKIPEATRFTATHQKKIAVGTGLPLRQALKSAHQRAFHPDERCSRARPSQRRALSGVSTCHHGPSLSRGGATSQRPAPFSNARVYGDCLRIGFSRLRPSGSPNALWARIYIRRRFSISTPTYHLSAEGDQHTGSIRSSMGPPQRNGGDGGGFPSPLFTSPTNRGDIVQSGYLRQKHSLCVYPAPAVRVGFALRAEFQQTISAEQGRCGASSA